MMSNSKQTRKVIEATKRLLKAKGITYGMIAESLGLSLPSIKRVFSQGEMSLGRLEQICEAAGVQMTELFRMIETEEKSGPAELTLDQERALAKSPKNFAYFELLLGGMRPVDIEREFKIGAAQTAKYLSLLERLELIEWLPRNLVRLKVSNKIRLRADGPLRSIFTERSLNDFLQGDFRSPLSHRDFMLTRMSAATAKELIEKLIQAANQAAQTGEMEVGATIPTESMGIHLAIRRWRLADSVGL